MADQTTSNTPSDPVLCKAGCGFFGSSATEMMCSKCWREVQKSKEDTAVTASKSSSSSPPPAVAAENLDTNKPSTSSAATNDIDMTPAPEASKPATGTSTSTSATSVIKKKKKKKASYKNMMASMMSESSKADGSNKDHDGKIKKVTGGGAFSKIDKI